jgi:hypothetical protein
MEERHGAAFETEHLRREPVSLWFEGLSGFTALSPLVDDGPRLTLQPRTERATSGIRFRYGLTMSLRLAKFIVANLAIFSLLVGGLPLREAHAQTKESSMAMAGQEMPCHQGQKPRDRDDSCPKPCSDTTACFAKCFPGAMPMLARLTAPIVFVIQKQRLSAPLAIAGRSDAPPSRPPKA